MSLGGDIGNKLIEIVEKVRADLIANDFATKSYVEEIISSGIISKIVATLPATGEQGIIYLVPVTTQLQTEYNVYKEYVYVNGAWEDLGSTELNLEDYPNKTYITDRLATKLNKNDPSIPTKLTLKQGSYIMGDCNCKVISKMLLLFLLSYLILGFEYLFNEDIAMDMNERVWGIFVSLMMSWIILRLGSKKSKSDENKDRDKKKEDNKECDGEDCDISPG